ncbi:MAG: hypothetical protein EZS28_016898 [Streblomastix strix]|uniref:Uncharacterized protein n=1 Tax=Streblomastix strix TaxID=222440 RepID=A0A5J4VY70_9EUKA|nr:MAG: hypothetical protein EZS28_016898 [Streblomastix strix]
MLSPNSELRAQPLLGQGQYTPRNEERPQSTIFPSVLNAVQEIPGISNILKMKTIKDHMCRRMLKGFDLIPVDKDDEGQHWPGYGPGIPHATDRRKSKQQS